MTEAGDAPAAPSNKSTSQNTTEHFTEPSDEAPSPYSFLQNSLPDSAFDEAFMPWDNMHFPSYEALDGDIPATAAQVTQENFHICHYCGRYHYQDSECCPECGSIQYSAVGYGQTLQYQSQAKNQEPLSTSEEDSSWLNFLTPEIDFPESYLPDGVQDQDTPAMLGVESQVLDELVFDAHMNPVPNPRRRRRRLHDGERELVARKRGKVCGSCRRRHMKCEHVVVDCGRGAIRAWVCPAHKLLPMLDIGTIAVPGYTTYQRYPRSLEPLMSTCFENRNRSSVSLLLGSWTTVEPSRYIGQINSVVILLPTYPTATLYYSVTLARKTEYINTDTESLWAQNFSSGIDLEVLCTPNLESPEPKPWSVLVLEAARKSLVQSAREARSFVSHGRGAPWTLLFRDLFTRGQSHRS